MRFNKLCAIKTSGIILLACQLRADEATFQGLGDLPGGSYYSVCSAISPSGLTAVGAGSAPGLYVDEGFVWTAEGGMQPFGDYVSPLGASFDGLIIIGSRALPGATKYTAFRWDNQTGFLDLGRLAEGNGSSAAHGISGDGSVIVGTTDVLAFKWTSGTGMISLGRLPGVASGGSSAYAISGDGKTIVGDAITDPNNDIEAFSYTDITGMERLGLLPNAAKIFSTARAVSYDGSVIVGSGLNADNSFEAFRWTAQSGLVGLGDLGGGQFHSVAYAVSADGEIIVGFGTGSPYSGAMIWDKQHGMRSITNVLLNQYGISEAANWFLESALAISADGTTIAGYGFHYGFGYEGWVARIPRDPIACPGDLNDDGLVDLSDLAQLLTGYGAAYGDAGYQVLCDIDRNGVIDLADLALLLANYGGICP